MSVQRRHVLVVEDNQENRYLVTLLLEMEGYEVIAVDKGKDGLAALDQHDFAFVVLDLQLPDIDGFEVAEKIRERQTVAELPIIAVSAFAALLDRRRAFGAGCSGYLEKPIEADTFVAQVRCMAGVEALS